MTSMLRGKTALVTGASSGIGQAIALKLASHGVNLCLVGRNEARLRDVRDRARKWSDVVEDLSVDLSELDSLDQVVNLIEGQFKTLDIIVHSAGVISLKKVEEAGADE